MLDFLVEFFETPAIMLAVVALIGLLLQRRSAGEVFSGTVKTALGMIMLSSGSSLIVTYITPFSELFTSVFGLSGFATSSESISAAMQTAIPVVGSASALILGVGFLVNVLLARFSPLKYVFLTGHMLWILSVVVAFVLYTMGLDETMIVIVGSVIQGLVTTTLPAISQPYVRRVTGGSDMFAVGHLTTLGTVAASTVGGLLGDKSKSAEDIKLPESLEFFKDTSMSVSIVIGVFYLVLVVAAGPEAVAAYSGGSNYILFGLTQALGFTVGILVLLQGVRLFLGEIVPAFKGISDKLVPGAIPALDVPALFGFAPNSLMLGFVGAVVGMLLAMVASAAAFQTVPLISIIGAFFTGGVAGIFGNVTGGRRGAVISGFLYGFFLIFFAGFVSTLYDFAAYGAEGVGHDCIDVMAFLTVMKQPVFGIAVVVALFVVMCFVQVRRNKKDAEASGK